MLDREGRIRPVWNELHARIESWSTEDRSRIAQAATRLMKDLGTTYNVYSDVGGAGQPYQIDPVPLILSPEEWVAVAGGLVQRMNLLEALLADLYGPQKALLEGLIPPELVHANPAFHANARHTQPVGGFFLLTTGCDLIRSPGGNWTVLKDHTRLPGGLGQVLENRSVTSGVMADSFDAANIAHLGAFFDHERSFLQSLPPQRAEPPNLVFLTPGFQHPSYFEHAYKAKLLGFPLVEAADLTVRERRVFLKTLSGLRRVDGIVCRSEADSLDPLEFWTLGGRGVPGLVEAWRSGNVMIANAPGAGFAETAALMPFLPAVCRAWFGEDLKLPFVETWWLGQPEIREKVLSRLERYVLLPAFHGDPLLPLRAAHLSPTARRHWIAEIEARPHDFVAQRDVPPSRVPSLQGRTLQPKPLVWRAFTLRNDEGPVALPCGLARVGKTGEPAQLWPAHAGYAKDVWVPDSVARIQEEAILKRLPHVAGEIPAADVPSRIAEQLFWVGRYAERVEWVTRLSRVTLRSLAGGPGVRQQRKLDACLALLMSGGVGKSGKLTASHTLPFLHSLVHGVQHDGGLIRWIRALFSNAAAARDRLSDDTWKFLNRLENIVRAPSHVPDAPQLLVTLDELILNLAAFSGMESENMTRGHGWRFLETGRRIERALGGLAALETASSRSGDDSSILSPLLEAFDSVMTYRRRHFSRPQWHDVLDLLFFNSSNPRSVAFQIEILCQEGRRFPGDPTFGLLPKIAAQLAEFHNRFQTRTEPTTKELAALGDSLENFSDLLTQHYFSHSVRRVY